MAKDKNKIDKCLARLKRGENCFDELVKSSIGYVGYVVYNRLVDKSFFGDAVNETYRNVVRYVRNFDCNGNGVGWICKIAENEAYKVNNKERRNEVALDDSVIDDCTSSMSDAVIEIIDLYRALDRLDETDKKIIEYIFLENKTYKEIAAELNLSIGDVGYRKKSALKRLLKLLSD